MHALRCGILRAMFARVASVAVLVGLVVAAPAAAHPGPSTLGGALGQDRLPGRARRTPSRRNSRPSRR